MRSSVRKPRILLVLAHFDDMRNRNGRPNFLPQGVGHAFLAGAFDRNAVEIRIHSEFHSGPLLDERAFAWPDMLVLTGVTSAFDRMCQLAAYARTRSPGCVVVAGGPAVRNLPLTSARVFDFACQGDVEELSEIARDVFGAATAASEVFPRFDLLSWKSPVNYVESSRYCNFRCSFCALTAERREYRTWTLAHLERQIRSYPRSKILLFLDNNFYGNDRAFFLAKLDLLESLFRDGSIPGWIALVTSDFFVDSRNIERARRAGCLGLFCGIESFTPAQIKSYDKRQNLILPQHDLIRSCLEAGIVFQYGLIFDPTSQRLSEMEEELDFVFRHDEIPLPAFLSLTIPLLGTPYFHKRLSEGAILPMAKLRDMDGFTLMTRPLDGVNETISFVRGLAKLDGRRRQVFDHGLRFWRRYRRSLSWRQMASQIANGARLCTPSLINGRRLPRSDDERLTYVTTTQPLGPLYTPAFPVPERFSNHFRATFMTDASGGLSEQIAADVEAAQRPAHREKRLV
ncbi:B12-binding domain-containing radical SAM protein [Bosea sp. (in: a-proteobacteria)]|uniref:B12-binding domain-containing radical SAM protein n=1 Tax=Bosea sp. (in: a-proteobacteria) TaxID=1871050 RepID=UPI002FCAC665